MFEVGEKIVYPMHGASIVKGIEDKEILGETVKYYVISTLVNNIQVMIPVEKALDLGIRGPIDADSLEELLSTLKDEDFDPSENPKHRYRDNLNKLKTGDIHQGVEVIRTLTVLSKTKKLGTQDKKMLDNAQQLFISELMLVKDIAYDEATSLLKEAIEV
ncbi:CarD family transcriptional regulator [Pseudalkalibacillus caeni]|uniref:CarD family transcriptional regulator n=1 Tax=Exobacillus caeni TaxID=2574798 RepID=A0A5R9EYC5_9BACL|nr:CarD family transcriptional regulator [Pseudalkalibacillus caeni]TLS35050.1 CarD family transcriptional regulator [Pseudalkalibacillus caeni]